jgi:signal transduction histidine kinase
MRNQTGPASGVVRRLLVALRERETQISAASKSLHDDVSQGLSALGIHLDMLRSTLAATAPELEPRVEEMEKILDQVIGEVRDLTYRLNPEIVERGGLRLALERLVSESQGTFAGELSLDYRISSPVETALARSLYRITGWALSNAIRHANAHRITITATGETGSLQVTVRDDGTGFDVEKVLNAPKGLGLLRIFWESELAGVDFVMDSTPGAGTICSSKQKK